MADYTLIDEYLVALRRETCWLRDVEEIIEEAADHLLEAAEKRIAQGVDRVVAQRRALIEFGDPAIVGLAFSSSSIEGAGMPTQLTRSAGYALIVSALLWVVGGASILIANEASPAGFSRTLFNGGGVALLAAGLLAAAGVVGVNRRHGGALGIAARIGSWLFVVAGIAMYSAIFSYTWEVWVTALTLGAGLFGATLASSEIAPRYAGVLIGLGAALLGGGMWFLEIFNPQSFGRGGSDIVVGIFLYSAVVILALGEALLGRWMATEVVDEPAPAVTA